MIEPAPVAALCAVARNRAAVMEELRRLIPGPESFGHKTLPFGTLSFGLAAIDSHLPEGGLTCGALHEVVPQPHATPAAFGFIAAVLGRIPRRRPLFFVMPTYGLRGYGRPYGHGLARLGLD